MIIDLKRCIDLRWLFDLVLLFILGWSCFSLINNCLVHPLKYIFKKCMKTDKMRHWGPVGSYWAEKSSEIFSNHFDYFLFPDLFLRQIPTIRTQYYFLLSAQHVSTIWPRSRAGIEVLDVGDMRDENENSELPTSNEPWQSPQMFDAHHAYFIWFSSAPSAPCVLHPNIVFSRGSPGPHRATIPYGGWVSPGSPVVTHRCPMVL